MNTTTSLDNYYIKYTDGSTTVTDNCYIEPHYPPYDSGTTWIHYDWYPYCTHPEKNRTEHAFEILKLLVKEKIISEPRSFKKFVELVEKITKVI